jgi:predicted dehydrogenase
MAAFEQTTKGPTDQGIVRWGIAGPGGIAAGFATGMQLVEGGSITAVASRSAERANIFADRFSIPTRHASYGALAADPDVDVVYVATPHSRHEADTTMFLEAGKHVLCEKPFALNARQATRMVEVARARNLFLMEAMWSRFLPTYRTLVELLDEGRIGQPLMVEADFGFRMPVMPTHRLFDPALGGGALLDLGIYPVQLCALVLGHPDRVVADGHIGETGVDEQLAAVLHHPGGRLGVVKASIRTGLSCRARVSGTDGWIDLPPFMHCPDRLTVNTPAGAEIFDGSFEGDGLRFQVEEVHRCLAAGLTESPTMPLDETVAIATTLDTIRAQVGVVYPGD